ncbi:MAG TPA: pyridoxamine 5'-phosphate oxidase family protein [Thermodesulfobacteriota bacterium]|nr:pyridoxamine 5'-phosphate oxidase family protein [Thermodesulfobacteriota bacterium]
MDDSTLPHQNEYEERITRDRIACLLDGHNTMSLATSRDGEVYAASLFYASDGLTLYFLSNPDSSHSVNIALNSRAAVTISKDHSDWRAICGLQIKGKVFEVTESEEEAARKVFGKKYPFLAGLLGNRELFRGARGISFYKVVPETVKLIDNTVHFGYKTELDL